MKEKMKMISLLLVSMMVVSWGAININIPAMSKVFDQVPLFLIENLATVSSLFIMISVLISNKIANRIGYNKTILIGLALVGVSGIFPLFFADFYIIFFCRALLGVGIGLFQPLLVIMNKYFFFGEQRTRMFGLQSAFEGVGGISFTFISGQLIKSSWQNLFYIYLSVIPIAVLFLIYIPSVSGKEILSQEKAEAEMAQKRHGTSDADNNKIKRGPGIKGIGYVLLIFILSSMYMIMGIKLTTLIIENGIGTATDGATVLLAIGIGAMSSGFLFARVVRQTKGMTLSLGYLGLAIGMIISAYTRSIWLLSFGGFLAGFSFRTIFPFFLDLVNKRASKNSNMLTALIFVALNLGAFSSPYVALLISKISYLKGISGIFLTNGILLLIMAGISLSYKIWIYIHKERTIQNVE